MHAFPEAISQAYKEIKAVMFVCGKS